MGIPRGACNDLRMQLDCVVAGGGIGGSVLAELLARGGQRVLVLERSVAAPTWTRPEIFWPTTADFVKQLAAGDLWERELAAPIDAFDIHDGRALRELVPAAALQRAGVRPWSTDPNGVREILLRKASFEVRRGVEVVGLLRDGARVAGVRAHEVGAGGGPGAEIEIPARWTVADDGVESAVRRACGIGIDLETFSLEFLCFGLDWPAALPHSRVRLWSNRRGTASGILGLGAVPLPSAARHRARAPEARRARDGSRGRLERFLDLDPLLREVVAGRPFPDGFAHVRRSFGHAERYGEDGAFLLGDAAHPVSPAGGQGSSMAVADARTLAEILLAGEQDPLADFERRRRAPNTRSVAITRLVHRVWTLPRWCRPTSGFFGFLALLRARPALLARMVRDVSTRFLEEAPGSP
jgi:2-polyprenyl-6-methoxyphenol hydroxylase-like FAD-dependent oxidoreductase